MLLDLLETRFGVPADTRFRLAGLQVRTAHPKFGCRCGMPVASVRR
jgi:hypothetical protein